jgi:hypothetical protein
MPDARSVNAGVRGGAAPPNKPAKGRPRGLTRAAKEARDKLIVHDRVVLEMSWASIALKYDLDQRSCERVVASYKARNPAWRHEISPAELIEDELAALETQVERLRALRERAEADENWAVVLGAEKQISAVRLARLKLMQQAKMLPDDLGRLGEMHSNEVVVRAVVSVLDRVERGEVEAGDVKKELYELIERSRPRRLELVTSD